MTVLERKNKTKGLILDFDVSLEHFEWTTKKTMENKPTINAPEETFKKNNPINNNKINSPISFLLKEYLVKAINRQRKPLFTIMPLPFWNSEIIIGDKTSRKNTKKLKLYFLIIE